MKHNVIFNMPSAVWGISLVDITETNVTRGNSKQRNQQRNWETVIQTAGLLTQAVVLQEPELYKYDNSDKFINSELYKKINPEMNCILTPHISGVTTESNIRVSDFIVKKTIEFFN